MSSADLSANVARWRFFRRSLHRKENIEHIGRTNSIQKFYEGPEFDFNYPNWVEYAPPSLPQVKKNKHEGAAIQIFKCRDRTLNRESFIIHQIRLQSPHLRDALKDTLAPLGITFKDNIFADSYYPHLALYFALDRIAELAQTADDDATRSHCELLCSIIGEVFDDTLEKLEVLEKDQKITFDLIWTLFSPGSTFAFQDDSLPPRAGKIVNINKDATRLKITFEYVIFDGFIFGTFEDSRRIASFEGTVEVTALPNFKYIDLSCNAGVYARLLERGQKALDLQDIQYKALRSTIKSDEETRNPWLRNQAHRRVLIDPYLYCMRQAALNVRPLSGYKGLNGEKHEDQVREPEGHDNIQIGRKNTKPGVTEQLKNNQEEKGPRKTQLSSNSRREAIDGHNKRKQVSAREKPRRPTKVEMERNKQVVLESETNLLTMYPHVAGYSLDTKLWDYFNIDDLYPIEEDRDVFEKVVLDEKKKDILKTLVESYHEHTMHYDDLIAGKGQCLLILLSGPPGTGKTLMVESLAEYLGCPLLRAESHFIQPDIFEIIEGHNTDLGQFLLDATEWGSLVLFDEPEFLFQTQNQESGDRKDLLVFLRHAEYFKGIIFLTTNLGRTIDPAVLSRAQIHITFPALTKPLRVRVWEGFVERLPDDVGTLSPSDIACLAIWEINGREIKNILNMAVSWCRKKGQNLSLKVVEGLIEAICPSAVREAMGLANRVGSATEMTLAEHEMSLLEL